MTYRTVPDMLKELYPAETVRIVRRWAHDVLSARQHGDWMWEFKLRARFPGRSPETEWHK